MPDLDNIDLDRLRRVAGSATPGPWTWTGSVAGRIELTAPGQHMGARIISAMPSEPCIGELDDDGSIEPGSMVLLHGACDACRLVVDEMVRTGNGDLILDHHCTKPENLGTVWVNQPGFGHVTPINQHATRRYPHRGDIGPGDVDHPNTEFIETFNPATVTALLDEVTRLRHDLARTRDEWLTAAANSQTLNQF